MDLISGASAHAKSHAGFYDQVDNHFTNSFLGMLLVSSLTTELPSILRDNPVFIEQDEMYTWVLHIGSIKLVVESGTDIAVHVHTNEGQRCGLLIYIWQTDADSTLTAEFQMVGEYGRVTEFKVPLPRTLGHPLCAMLADLKRIINHSDEKNVATRLKEWASAQT